LQILNEELKNRLQEANPMYAVVNSGGKQYKVQQGEVLRVEKISGDVGSPVTFDRVLMFSDGENVRIGQPLLDSVAVEGHIVEQAKAKKIIVFKYKRRKRFRRKNGHRQEFTAVLIDSIQAKGTKGPKVAEPKAEAQAEVKQPEAMKAAPKEEAAKETAARKSAPKKETAQKAEAKKAGPKKETAQKAEAKKAAPQEEAK
jgi:large subunit ribosomal protein L21